ncbi:MAG: ribonuclease HII [Candidatus Paceibacterota bacterium]
MFGLDEVGRGPLAGPVVVCAVCINKNHKIPDSLQKKINDSKKLTHVKRQEILKEIKNRSDIKYTIYKLGEKEIDKINILNTTLKAFKRAVMLLEKKLNHKPDLILIDGNKIIKNLVNYKQQAIINGDSKVLSIALASIIAKEYRDNLMIKYAKQYPKYDFEINKGYGTKKHREAIKKFGICKIHRKSFLNKIQIGKSK